MSRSSQRNQRDTRRRLDPTLPEGAVPSETGLLGPLEVKAISEALGIRPTKVLGQNFVHDAGTVRKIVAAGGVEAGDEVVEVGPGLGSLTLALLEVGARVRAVEIDPPLAAALPETVRARMSEAADRFHVVTMDATEISGVDDFGVDWPAPTKLVANLPYNVAVPVLLNMLEAFPSIQGVVVMVQAEVADRLAAGPGSRTYGVPSVKASWYGSVERAGTIGRSVFWPVPGVDSALVRLTRLEAPRGTTSCAAPPSRSPTWPSASAARPCVRPSRTGRAAPRPPRPSCRPPALTRRAAVRPSRSTSSSSWDAPSSRPAPTAPSRRRPRPDEGRRSDKR